MAALVGFAGDAAVSGGAIGGMAEAGVEKAQHAGPAQQPVGQLWSDTPDDASNPSPNACAASCAGCDFNNFGASGATWASMVADPRCAVA